MPPIAKKKEQEKASPSMPNTSVFVGLGIDSDDDV